MSNAEREEFLIALRELVASGSAADEAAEALESLLARLAPTGQEASE